MSKRSSKPAYGGFQAEQWFRRISEPILIAWCRISPFHACGYAEILANDLILMADCKQNDCLGGVPSPFLADSKQSRGLGGVANTFRPPRMLYLSALPRMWPCRDFGERFGLRVFRQTQFVLKDSADASQMPRMGCIRCCVDASISCLPPVWPPKRVSWRRGRPSCTIGLILESKDSSH